MSGKHHGGHQHGGRRHGRGAFIPAVIYELDCRPGDPLYEECVARFGYDAITGYKDDLLAIRAYFDTTEAKTDEARKIKDDFIKWYDDIWFATEANFDLARNQRNRFNLANATSPEEKTQVEDVIRSGLSSEQEQGDPDRRLSTGMLPGPVAPPPSPLIPTKYLVAGGIGLASLVLLQLSRR